MAKNDSVFFKGLLEFDRNNQRVNYTFFHTVYRPGSYNHQTLRFKGTAKTPRLAMKAA